MYDRILVPTDGSDPADAAGEAAVALAERFGSELHAISVLELGDLPPDVTDPDADAFTHRGERAAAAVARRANEAGINATSTVVRGAEPTHRVFLDYAADHDVDCVVMGTHGRTGLDRFVLGSVTERTLRESQTPVMTVHDETVVDPSFEDVLVATDGSDPSLVAADHAVDLAAATGGTLHVVTAVDPEAVWVGVDAEDLYAALDEGAERAIDSVVDRAEAAGVDSIEATVVHGTPHEVVVDYAAEVEADSVVVGTHGRTGVDRLLLGSVSERVVRLADRPVIAVGVPDAD